MAQDGNGSRAAFDNLVWRLWEAAKDGRTPAGWANGPDSPARSIGDILTGARGEFGAGEQHDALLAAESLGRDIVAAMEEDLAQARKALAALQRGAADLMRQQIRRADEPS